MSPTPEASKRQREAAYKAWETIRRKKAQGAEHEARPDANIKALPARSSSKKEARASDYPPNWKEIGAEIRSRSRNANGEDSANAVANVSSIKVAARKSTAHGRSTAGAKARSKSAPQ